MDCPEEFRDLIASKKFRVVVGLQAFASFLAAIVGTIVIRKCTSLYFHVNCKILIISTLVLYVIHSVLSFHLYLYLSHTNSCEIAISTAFCFAVRFPTTACMASFAILQAGMVVERALALWKRNGYEQYGCWLGLTISLCCVLSALVLSAWAIGNMNLTTFTIYCSVSTNETAERITTLCFILCFIDIMSLAGTAILRITNVTAMKQKFSDLQSAYQLRENDSVLRLLLPLILFNVFCHLAFSGSSALLLLLRTHFSYVNYRTIFAAGYTVPYFTLVSPILLWFIIKKSRQSRVTKLKSLGKHTFNERELYFNAYSQMWNDSQVSRMY
ncbi:hypothetical protein V3C99_013012 [Haemonchus contortus]